MIRVRRELLFKLSKIVSREIATSRKSDGMIKRSCLKLSYRGGCRIMSMMKTKKKPKNRVMRKSMGRSFLKIEKIVMPNPNIMSNTTDSVNWIPIKVGKYIAGRLDAL